MKITSRPITVMVGGAPICLRRTAGGVIVLKARDDSDLARGMGFAHAMDRTVQMMLTRLAGQGRLCECLRDDDELLAIDVFARQAGFAHYSRREAENLGGRARAFGEAYCDGVNAYLERHRRRLEFLLVGYRPEPWQVADTLLIIKLMSYLGLAQLQQNLEKLIIQAVQNGVPVERLKQLFAPHLDGLDEQAAALIRNVNIAEPVLSPQVPFAPVLGASNNWAVSGAKTASGFPMQCNDPHLECNRLPAVWYEFVAHTADDYRIGVNIPGIPGLIMGRTRHVSMGFTYGFMDMIDYFVEECRGNRYRQGDEYRDLELREEVIRRKKKVAVRILVRSSPRGVLECDPHAAELPDGRYLCRAFACHDSGAAECLDALAAIGGARTVEDVQRIVRRVCISCNWAIADRAGNIGYQQSGYLPVRNHSGLYPLPGWIEANAWNGIVDGDCLASRLNPPEQIVVTANDEWNPTDAPTAVNMAMGPYRAERIAELLKEKDRLTPADMKRIQGDLYSVHARRFMQVLRPLLPENPAGRILAGWDLCYDADSKGATLFEAFYENATRETIGRGLFGYEAWDALAARTAMIALYFHRFDEILLGDDPTWYPHGGRAQTFRRILEEITAVPPGDVPRWATRRRVMMHNLLFGGKLPRLAGHLLGVDYGPITVEGGRATIVQSARFVHHGHLTHFAPSYRYIADLGTDEAHTVLAGGPSDRMGSRWYTSDVKRWLAGGYKTLRAERAP